MNPSCPLATTDVGPHAIDDAGAIAHCTDASVHAEPPMNTVPAGPTSMNDNHRVVPEFVRWKS